MICLAILFPSNCSCRVKCFNIEKCSKGQVLISFKEKNCLLEAFCYNKDPLKLMHPSTKIWAMLYPLNRTSSSIKSFHFSFHLTAFSIWVCDFLFTIHSGICGMNVSGIEIEFTPVHKTSCKNCYSKLISWCWWSRGVTKSFTLTLKGAVKATLTQGRGVWTSSNILTVILSPRLHLWSFCQRHPRPEIQSK